VGFTIHPLLQHPTFACRVALSKSQHVSRLRLLPAVEFLSEAKAAFACRFFSSIPVRSSVAWGDKKEEPHRLRYDTALPYEVRVFPRHSKTTVSRNRYAAKLTH
jgi:hypothetical protein